jgi:hypothetical protein
MPLFGRHQHDRLVTGTRDSDRPAVGLYLFCGCGQPPGIVALLTVHNIRYDHSTTVVTTMRAPSALTPRVWLFQVQLGSRLALPIRSPTGRERRILPGGSVIQLRPPEP